MSVSRVILPKLGLTMDEGTLVSWLKREGDRVEQGEVLFEVETDKSIMEVEAPASGYVRSILRQAGDTVPVAETVALITTLADEPVEAPQASGWAGLRPGEDEPSAGGSDGQAADGTATAETEATTAGTASGTAGAMAAGSETRPAAPSDGGRIAASPAARKRAQELGVDLSTVTASNGTRISIEDVEAAAAATATVTPPTGAPPTGAPPTAGPAPAGGRVPLSRMRRAIGAAMTASFRDVPQFSIGRDVDMTAARETNARSGLSYADILISAAARTLRDHPALRMRLDGDALVPAGGIGVGYAVALEDGLIVPVLHDADGKEPAAIAAERRALQDGARAGRLPADALGGAVMTITNLGQFGVDRFTAILNPPEASILAVGRVREQAIVRDGAVVVAPVMTLTLSVDHRVADGAQAARFLSDLAERLESGAQ